MIFFVDIAIKPEDLVIPTTDETEKTYRPPINVNATTVDQIYDLNKIITKNELESLNEMALECLDKPIEEEK